MCIVSDGRQKINQRTLSLLATLGVYQDGIAKNIVGSDPVTAHIYEVCNKRKGEGRETKKNTIYLLYFFVYIYFYSIQPNFLSIRK